MVKTTTETYCDDDETIEFFSEFYSYCAERLKMKTTTTGRRRRRRRNDFIISFGGRDQIGDFL